MTTTTLLDDDDLETILTIARNNQSGRIARGEVEALVAAYRTLAAKDRRLSVEINRVLGRGGPVAEVAAVLSERMACAQIARAEGDQRLAYSQAARNGSREWGDPDAAAMAQGHKAVTAHGIAKAIMARGEEWPADDADLARRANELRGEGPFPLRSTPAMRVRARELAMPHECDFDRAVIDIIDDLEAMIVAAARFTPAPVVLGEALQKLYNAAEAEQAKFFEDRKFDLCETRRQRCLGIAAAIDVVEKTLAEMQTPASVAISEQTIAREIAHGCFVMGIEIDPKEIGGLAHGIARLIAAPATVGGKGENRLTLDTDRQVFFYEQDFYVLSNFSSFGLAWKGLWFASSEVAYHWEKFATAPDVQRLIHDAPSAHDAFKLAERHKHRRRADWDDVKADIMLELLREKVRQHEYVRRKLLETGERELIENSWRDPYWGWGPQRNGQNMLGKLWMQVREELRAPATQTEAAQ